MRERSNASGPRSLTVLWVPVQPHFGQESRVPRGGAEDLVVGDEEVLLALRVVRQALEESLVQGSSGLGLTADLPAVLPPGVQITPAQALDGDLTVVDEGVVRVASDDLDVVVHRGPEADVGLGERGKDDVLRPPGATTVNTG
ncbi:hypothetical protein [Streptomyces luteogriseus]|uniref:hypothetical protein n=1 Tax=Streptomyces luteogriseus TaxID=68233 RepID=UPI001FE3486D|nr:hypothetical protein [Streptomyces luteogriseus]